MAALPGSEREDEHEGTPGDLEAIVEPKISVDCGQDVLDRRSGWKISSSVAGARISDVGLLDNLSLFHPPTFQGLYRPECQASTDASSTLDARSTRKASRRRRISSQGVVARSIQSLSTQVNAVLELFRSELGRLGIANCILDDLGLGTNRVRGIGQEEEVAGRQ